jgi:hypothetical protein
MAKAALLSILLWIYSCAAAGQSTGEELIYDNTWRAFPFDKKEYHYTPKTLEENWPYLQRQSNDPFPDASHIAKLLSDNPNLKNAIPHYKSVNKVADTLQEAWIAFFKGQFQKATQLGYSLGPIGHCVAFYAQSTYASRLETNKQKRHALWEDILQRHEKSKALTKYDVTTQFFAFFSMARLSEELSMPTVVARDYLNIMIQALAEMNAQDPNNIFVLAALGSKDAGVVRKLGKLMARLAFDANHETIERYYLKAINQNKQLPTVHIEYAQALLYMYGKKKLDEAIQHMRTASEVPPLYALESMNTFKAKKLLSELMVIKENNGYGLRRYVKRNNASEKNYYF